MFQHLRPSGLELLSRLTFTQGEDLKGKSGFSYFTVLYRAVLVWWLVNPMNYDGLVAITLLILALPAEA